MKVLFLCPDFPDSQDRFIGGYFIKELVRELSAKLDELLVVSPTPFSFGRTQADRLCTNYDLERVRIRFPRYLHTPLTKKSGILFDRIATLNARAIESAVENVAKSEDFDYDLVHSHFTWPCGQAASILKGKRGKPSVLTVHENEEWLRKELSTSHHCYQDAWTSADTIIRVNKKNVVDLQRFNSRVVNIPDGYDSERYFPKDKRKARRKLGIPIEGDIIFSLGKLTSRKGYCFLIRAMKSLSVGHRNLRCFIGGTGPLEKELKSLISDLSLEGKVTLLGFVSQAQMNDWMNTCDLYAQPSLSESFGVVQLCAMGCGKPVIATRNGGSEEVVTSDDFGLLCEPGDENALREALEAGLQKKWDPELILGNALGFTWKRVAASTVELYQSLLEQ